MLITAKKINKFKAYLIEEEKSDSTIEKYMRAVRNFTIWLDGKAVTKELSAMWKEDLRSKGYQAVSINCMLTALNCFFAYFGQYGFKVRYLKVQKKVFSAHNTELSKEEYTKLVTCAAKRKNERLSLIIETIAATGIRVSETGFITVEAIKDGYAEVSLKGKVRTILIPKMLCRKLKQYADKNKITSGYIFVSKNGRPLNRREIWLQMKRLCKYAGVEPSKVFPHNLRHLFARAFYKACQDIVKLADVLGHSRVETTRIYLRSTAAEHANILERMHLIM